MVDLEIKQRFQKRNETKRRKKRNEKIKIRNGKCACVWARDVGGQQYQEIDKETKQEQNTYVYTNSSISHKNIIRSLSCILCCAVPCQAYQMISPMSCWCVFSSEYSFIYCTCSASMESFFHSFQSAASNHTYRFMHAIQPLDHQFSSFTCWPMLHLRHLVQIFTHNSALSQPTYARMHQSIGFSKAAHSPLSFALFAYLFRLSQAVVCTIIQSIWFKIPKSLNIFEKFQIAVLLLLL